MPKEEKENKTKNLIQAEASNETESSNETSIDDAEIEDTEVIDSDEAVTVAESEDELPQGEDAVRAEEVSRTKARAADFESWQPKTALGKLAKASEITDLKDVIARGEKILEPEIVDILIANLETDLLLVGQAKGKFGGGQRRVFKQTQKKTREGNKPSFTTMAAVGNKNGYIGIGHGKARETVPAREKAFRDAKRNIIMIRRGSGSWEGASVYPNSIPFKVSGKCGSVEMELIPAPVGTGLCIEPECAKILKLAGIQDVWSKTRGQAKTKVNQIKACFEALKKLTETKVQHQVVQDHNIVTGPYVEA